MDRFVAAGILKMASRRRALLFAALVALGICYLVAFGYFRARSRDFIAAAQERGARAFALAHPLPLTGRLAFGTGAAAVGLLADGWHAVERDGTWTDSRRARLFLFSRCACELQLTFRAGVFQSRHLAHNAIEVVADGRLLARSVRSAADAWGPLRVRVPRDLVARGPLDIEIRTDRSASPWRLGDGSDRRVLGAKLSALDFQALPQSQ